MRKFTVVGLILFVVSGTVLVHHFGVYAFGVQGMILGTVLILAGGSS